jgi:hypothetical protein
LAYYLRWSKEAREERIQKGYQARWPSWAVFGIIRRMQVGMVRCQACMMNNPNSRSNR